MPDPEPPAVSVVVPCLNEGAHIESCLRSILLQKEPAGGFEVIVADGMSDDSTRDILARMAVEYPRLRVVDNPSRITPCGMNQGIRAARGRWIAIMGCHNRYAADYLVRCVEVARATGAENVGGGMISEGTGLVQRAIAAAHHSPFSVGGARWHDAHYEGPADTVFGGFYRREVFARIGMFDEELVRNQDDELNLRLARAGGRIWQCPAIRSWYSPRDTLLALFLQYLQYGYWKVRVIQKHSLPASWRHLVPGTFVLTLAVLMVLSLGGFLMSGLVSMPLRLGRAAATGLLALLVVYGGAVLLASVFTARRGGWRLLPVLPLTFACYHLGYGSGFLRGVVDFGIRRKRLGARFVELTRRVPRANRVAGSFKGP